MPSLDSLLAYLRAMLRIRRFEEKLLALFREGALRGTAHVCLGQEAVAVGAAAALEPEDYLTSNHRGHGHMLARGADMNRVMAELFGKAPGYSLGRGGSQHIAATEVGFLGSNGITGGGLPIAVGAALSLQYRKVTGAALAFFGDGAAAQGTFHEALNLAALWRLPLIFLCENNHYAMGTHVSKTSPTARLADRARGYDVPGETVDGNDPLAVESAVAAARARAVSGEGPSLVEAVTYRAAGHSRSDQGEYRPQEEEEYWAARDPIKLIRERLLAAGAPEASLTAIEEEAGREVEAAVQFARAAEPLPVEQAAAHVYPVSSSKFKVPSASGTDGLLPETSAHGPGTRNSEPGTRTYAEALRLALARALADPAVILLGEDIATYQGAFKVTRGLAELYGPERVRDTPISENTIIGAGAGAAITGLRPVVEIMFMDFLLLGLDQLGNHAAKFSYIYGGQMRVPLVIRTPAGGRRGYGPTHSQCFESLLLSLPGLKVFTPATVQDAYELLLAAIYDEAPVAFVEHKLLYGLKGELDPEAEPLPPGQARVARAGSDLTIVTFSHMLTLALKAAAHLEQEGVSAEVIDLRTLEPLDFETVAKSACRTQRVIVAEEGQLRGGVGAELAARIQEECFGYLDAPVLRVAAANCPVPTAEHLEEAVLPQAGDIVAAAHQALA